MGYNKHSIEVSGDEQIGFDFGVVSPDSGQRSLRFDIEPTGPEKIKLADIRLSSKTGVKRFSVSSP